MIQNADIFDFSLNDEEIACIHAMNLDKRVGPDPEEFDFVM